MELLQLFLATIILWGTGTAVILVLIGFFPRFTAQAEALVTQSSGRAFGVGLVNLFFLGILILILLALGQNVSQLFSVLALLFLAALGAAMLLGLAGLARLLGQRLWPDKAPVTGHASAAALLLLACLTPFAGWFVLLPILLTVGLGACVILLIGRFQQKTTLPDAREPGPESQA